MSREQIFGALRRALGNDTETRAAAVDARLAGHGRATVPARSAGDSARKVAVFLDLAKQHETTVAEVASTDDVPAAIMDYLSRYNLERRVTVSPHPDLTGLPWASQPLLEVAARNAEAQDAVSVTRGFAGIAETGTLVLHSGDSDSTTLNFLPEHHLVVLKKSQIVGSLEDVWDRLREDVMPGTNGAIPRTVNLVTGPSRTGDIEQTLYMGAHGPKNLHIVLVDDA